ncbi:aldehyde dehydrogenase family protein [Mesorhizobium sp. M0140]|uniref:aldehyde dehydrogenase family protein n=1 Tax=Mesorhizobium sp. M0140 TaxID=2956893 RepID=UPI0033364D9E
MASVKNTNQGRLVVCDPDDGNVVGETPLTSVSDVNRILDLGYRASRERPPAIHERVRILQEVADRVAAEAESHAHLIAREGIKTIREARAEVKRAIETLRLSAEQAKQNVGSVIPFDQVPAGEGRLGWWANRPAGLVVAITPYNDPLNLVAHKLGPAFAAGCPVILKPHPQTPFSAIRLVEHFLASGAIENRIQIVIGAAEVGGMLVADRRPRIISFTGGREAGERIAHQSGVKQLLLELGGVGIVAVAADANIEAAAQSINSGAFWAAGQNCVRAQRIIADDKVVAELTERLVARAADLRSGSKIDETTDIGPLVDTGLGSSLGRSVQSMKRAGGTVLCGGEIDGTRMRPTWVAGLPARHTLLGNELFGPVATIETAQDDSDLLGRIQDGPDAIHVAIFTQSISLATAAFEKANAAAVIINDSTDFRIDAMPFGGVGAAGLGREGVAHAISAMSEKKLLIISESGTKITGDITNGGQV